MIKHRLKINDDKTEFLVLASPNMHQKLDSSHHLQVGSTQVTPTSSARNLGVTFDRYMKMEEHITNICKSANFHLRNIGAIRPLLDDKSAAQLIHSFVTSRLDYCNSLLIGLPGEQISRLQRIQNHAARIVTRTKKFDHITLVLQTLHWLPVKLRIEYKILLLTYRTLNNMAPGYLMELLTPYRPPRTLRSSQENLLVVPKSKLKTYGDRSFCAAAPKAWNNLPISIRSCQTLGAFKSSLKTYLFGKYFKV